LAGGVGHELRNPLGVISNAVYFLRMSNSDADETIREYYDIIASEVWNAERIVSDLLDFSRTRKGESEEIAVLDLVTEALEKQPWPENVEVFTKIAPDLAPVFVEPRQIVQILVNLISNAYQAMPEGGDLTVSGRQGGGRVYVSITDTGSGILEQDMNKIFEPLFTTRARGIGLGLSVSRNLIEANGGSLEVESKEGKGSVFTIALLTKDA